MLIGPVFAREVATLPRRSRFFIYRSIYVSVLLVLIVTAWFLMTGTQNAPNIGDMSRFGTTLFRVLSFLQLALMLFFSAMFAASSVAQEKDRQTLVLLLLTQLNNSELVLGKLLASLLNILVMLIAGLPLFFITMWFGGVTTQQILSVFVVTFVAIFVSGSLGSTLAFWREKTFQTLALTVLTIVFWLFACEGVARGILGESVFGIPCLTLATMASPLRAVVEAARPLIVNSPGLGGFGDGVKGFCLIGMALAAMLNLVAILRVRVWNPTREISRDSKSSLGNISEEEPARKLMADRSAMIPTDDLSTPVNSIDDQDTQPQIEKVNGLGRDHSRHVWDNPILWREICTWAYGRKVIALRCVYGVIFLATAFGVHHATATGEVGWTSSSESFIPSATHSLAPFFLVSLVLINALAVTSITNERDGRTLALLLATDLTPREFVFGKIGGIFWVTKEVVVAPYLLCLYLWWQGGISLENSLYVMGGLSALFVFSTVLGIHCGMKYASSRSAIGVSLGTVFFLFLGVVTCVLMMISFSGSFQGQFAPFLAFILGGGIGLNFALGGTRNPSRAIAVSSALVPFATFYAIVSFITHFTSVVFLVVAVTYGFTTAAMLIPALNEFDIAMGRTTLRDD